MKKLNTPFASYLTGEHSLVAQALGPVVYNRDLCERLLRWLTKDSSFNLVEPFDVLFNAYPLWDSLLAILPEEAQSLRRMEQLELGCSLFTRKLAQNECQGWHRLIHGLANCELDLMIRSGTSIFVFEFKVFVKGGLQKLSPDLEWQLIGEILTSESLKHIISDVVTIEYYFITNSVGKPSYKLKLNNGEHVTRLVAKSHHQIVVDASIKLSDVQKLLLLPESIDVPHISWSSYIQDFLAMQPETQLLSQQLLANPVLMPC